MKHRFINNILQSEFFNHISSMGYLPRWCILLIDILLCALAFALSVSLGNNMFAYGTNEQLLPIWNQFFILLGVQIVTFLLFHTYSGIIRYTTFVDMVKIMLAVGVASSLLMLTNFITYWVADFKPFLNTILIIYIFISFVLMFSLRVGIKTIYENIYHHIHTSPKVLIYGTKSAGIAIAKMLRSAGNMPYHPIGFIGDVDNKNKNNHNIGGLHIFELNEDLFIWMSKHNVQNVIISPKKMQEINPSKDLNIFLKHNIHVLTTPYFKEYDQESDVKNVGRISSIQIEDLLERPTIHIDTDNVKQIIKEKTVMITGAAGSIGSELVRQILRYNPQAVILYEIAESPLHELTLDLRRDFNQAQIIPIIGDIRNYERLEEVFKEFRPDVLYHAAAYKHVPLMESYPNEAIQTNVLGTKNVADLAVKYKVERFVMISTDKAVNPTNVMGASKRIAEIYVQSLYKHLFKQDANCTKFITTRFGNVLGSNGSVIPYFKKQIEQGGPVTVTHPEITRFFMTIPEACCLVMEASTLGNGGEIFAFDMGHPVKILDLANNMIRLAGYTPGTDIPIVFSGLRPGEKLYEELLNKKETTMPTAHEKIMIARVREFAFDSISEQVNHLIQTSKQNKPFITVQEMKQMVPEYRSKNSIYEQLD